MTDYSGGHGKKGLLERAKKIRYDTTAIQAKLTELMEAINQLPIPDDTDRTPCPQCPCTFPGPQLLAEHLYVSHDGPEPAHWLALEQRSAA